MGLIIPSSLPESVIIITPAIGRIQKTNCLFAGYSLMNIAANSIATIGTIERTTPE